MLSIYTMLTINGVIQSDGNIKVHEIKSFIENNLLKDFKSIGLTHEKFFYGFFTLEQSLL